MSLHLLNPTTPADARDLMHLLNALRELAHANHQVAEASAYAKVRERDPQNALRLALSHVECARANLRKLLEEV